MTNVFGGSSDPARGTWCTPEWLAKIIGKVDLDPCSNPRSHIQAEDWCSLEEGTDGLATLPETYYTVFINPPYERGGVIKWIEHYKHTRFIFLLKWSPDTKWFARLIGLCDYVWFPNRRVNFEPPPGVKSSNNPLPHALYLRNPPADLILRLETSGYLIPLDGATFPTQHTSNEDSGGDVSGGRKGRKGEGRARSSGGSVREACTELVEECDNCGYDETGCTRDEGCRWDDLKGCCRRCRCPDAFCQC